MQNLLAEQKETAQQALKATTAELQATLIEKARAVEEKIKETAQAFFTELQQGSQSFLEAALQNILNIKLSVVQPTIQKIQELITRVINALKPLNTVRLKDQLMDIVNDLNIMLNKSTQLQNDWQTAITQIAQRTAWIQSHIRPTWAGGKTNEEIAAEAKTLYPLAAVADDIWNFYPHIIAKVNNLKLYGPALIFDSLVKRTAELLREMQVLNISMGKIGQAIISAELSGALQELEVKLVRLGENIKTAANIKPILSNPPATTSQALMEAFKGFAWRVGFDLPNKMNSYLNKMLGEYNRLNPVIEQIIEENNILTQLTQNMTTILKQDVLQRIADKPVINSARLPLILAQSLGLLVTQMKAVINDVLIKTDTVLEGLTGVLDDAKPMIELVNNAFGGTFINPALIQGLDTVKDDVHNLRPTMQKVRKGITDAIKIPFGV